MAEEAAAQVEVDAVAEVETVAEDAVEGRPDCITSMCVAQAVVYRSH